METKTFADLINWTRELHGQLAACFLHCAKLHADERSRLLLEYLAGHEVKIEQMILAFEEQADPKGLHTFIYDYESHAPITTHRACDAHYAELSFDDICREVFDFHEQVIALYRSLVGKAEIPEAKSLLEGLLKMEEHEAMRISTQTGRMNDL